MPYEELDHTADILIRIREPSLPALFAQAGEALMTIMYHGAGSGTVTGPVTITIDGTDHEQLLHSFLSELLFLSETENQVFSGISVILDNLNLTATMQSEPFVLSIHGGGTEVKGISYHEMSIRQQNDEYVLDILFDV